MSAADLPDGAALSAQVAARQRPRMLASGASFAELKRAGGSGENAPVLALLRARANWALGQPVPAAPDGGSGAVGVANLQQVQATRNLVQIARNERFIIENLSLIGRLDENASMLQAAKTRTLALANWMPNGVSSEKNSDQANREVFTALAQGLDWFWGEWNATERSKVVASLRDRVLQTSAALKYLDREPYDSHSQSNVRLVVHALALASGAPEFPEAAPLLVQFWNTSLHQVGVWGRDGSFGNGIAYGWYHLNGLAPFAAAMRVVAGVDLYRTAAIRNLGDMLVAFTPPARQQPSAFGDEMETRNLYDLYSSSFFRLHAQQSRSSRDAWFWRFKPTNVTAPSDASIWQILLLGSDSRSQPTPTPPSSNDWFSADSGYAAMHVDIARPDRTSVFFRSSRFGAFNHSHADQNSVAYVSQGQPLLINAGYYPYYNSPHHLNTRSTRYKNALTFDGGFGQSESSAGAARPTNAFHSMDASGALIRTHSSVQLSAVTGDATLAYRGVDPVKGTWVPALTNAVRSVVMDKTNGVTLVYDWATSATARQWELNFHSPNPFAVNAASVSASNGAASVCLDRYGPASQFTQTSAWEVAPETAQAAQAHGRFTVLARSTEFAHLTVLRDSCRTVPVTVQQTGTQINVIVAGRQTAVFDKRALSLGP
ncbi:heparinase II/III family protein [Inhella sp.]|uniref:heparinase II/III domain-containing protein n=1 Tax=Inhella sp. TaxID=1921806 RepID=UPI0035B2EF3E